MHRLVVRQLGYMYEFRCNRRTSCAAVASRPRLSKRPSSEHGISMIIMDPPFILQAAEAARGAAAVSR